jgi:hypothetical protein
LILAMDNALGGDRPVSLSKVLLLGQIRIGMPETARGDVVRIVVDFLGYLDFDGRRFGFFARLRDSRLVAVLELTGSLLVLIDYGDHPTFLVAAGGFHPRFQDLPAGLPGKLDRLGTKFKIGKVVNISISCYYAVTSATIQFGAEARVKVDLDAIVIEGYIGYDALIYYRPRFRFEVDFRAGMSIKVKGRTLMGVDVKGILSGPGRWRITGEARFKILFWKFSPSFDEQWGDQPVVPAVATKVFELLGQAYANPDNWSAVLPFGADTMVTLSASRGETQVLAHPLGQLRVSQKVAPLDLTLEKYGETEVDGPNRFDLIEVLVGGKRVAARTMTQEHLARGDYVKLTDEQRLSQPSFQAFDVGVTVGTQNYVVSAQITEGDLSYETKYLEPGEGLEGRLISISAERLRVPMAALYAHAQGGAKGRSALRAAERLRPSVQRKVVLTEPGLVAVDKRTLQANTELGLDAAARVNLTLAQQRLAGSGARDILLVEAFELE